MYSVVWFSCCYDEASVFIDLNDDEETRYPTYKYHTKINSHILILLYISNHISFSYSNTIRCTAYPFLQGLEFASCKISITIKNYYTYIDTCIFCLSLLFFHTKIICCTCNYNKLTTYSCLYYNGITYI